jgi:5-bromo-4-chloroindolyl phosphate hydrolysis protein
MSTGTALGIGAAAVFLGSYFFLGAGFFGSLVLSVVVYVGITTLAAWRSVKARRAEREGASSGGASGASSSSSTKGPRPGAMRVDLSGLNISEEDFNAALSTGAQKLTQLKRAAERITDKRVRGKAYAVCDSVARILSDIREDPKDLRPARKFLDYYLDATIKVVDRYASLASKSVQSDDLSASLSRVEESLDTIKSAYDKQLVQLLENDVMDLDTELEVLERTIKMEGLGDQ